MITGSRMSINKNDVEERIPLEIRAERAYRESAHNAYVNAALDESMLEVNNPNIKRLSHTEIMTSLKKQREARR